MGRKDTSNKIEVLQLPLHLPYRNEEKVMFIVNHNDYMWWSLNEGGLQNFTQVSSWQSPTISPDDMELDPTGSLFSFLAPPAIKFLFGTKEVNKTPTKEQVLKYVRTRTCPEVSVYILSVGDESTDPKEQARVRQREKGIEYLFRDYPSKLRKFRANHFFRLEQKLYSSMAIDKVATVYGAWKEYGGPVLVLNMDDTIIWYGGIGPNDELIGEGISAGLAIRFISLNDYTRGKYPVIQRQELHDIINKAVEQEKPLSMFGTDQKEVMVANITSELYNQVRNIIKQFESKVLQQQQPTATSSSSTAAAAAANATAAAVVDNIRVVITGADGVFTKNLLVNGPTMVDVEPGVELPKTDPTKYCCSKRLALVGMQYALFEHVSVQKPLSEDDELRQSIIGLRIATAPLSRGSFPSQNDIVRGTVTHIMRGDTMDDDEYKILYDDNEKKWINVLELYDGLRLFLEYGEKIEDDNSNWAKEKTQIAKTVQNELVTKSGKAEKRSKDIEHQISNGRTLVTVVGKGGASSTNNGPPTKKQRKSSVSGKQAKAERNPNEYINMRVAKYFDDALYFGRIAFVSNEGKGNSKTFWHILYDDDDEEDFEYAELREGITLYEENKKKDPKLKGQK